MQVEILFLTLGKLTIEADAAYVADQCLCIQLPGTPGIIRHFPLIHVWSWSNVHGDHMGTTRSAFVRGFEMQAENAAMKRRLAAKPKRTVMYLKPGKGHVRVYCPHCKIDFYIGKGSYFCPRCHRDTMPWAKAKKIHGWR